MEGTKERDLIKIGRNHIDAFNKGDWDQLKKLMSPKAVYIEPATGRRVEGPAEIVKAIKGWRTAFTDLKGEVKNIFAYDKYVIAEVEWKGTHNGTLAGPMGEFAATFKPCTVRSAEVFEFEGDVVKENRHYFDLFTMLQQLGLPVLEKPTAATF